MRESNHGIIGTELQGAVETELFLIYPVGDTVENHILLAIFGHLAFAVTVEQLYEKYIIVTHESDHRSVWRKDGDLLRSAVGQPLQTRRFV